MSWLTRLDHIMQITKQPTHTSDISKWCKKKKTQHNQKDSNRSPYLRKTRTNYQQCTLTQTTIKTIQQHMNKSSSTKIRKPQAVSNENGEIHKDDLKQNHKRHIQST